MNEALISTITFCKRLKKLVLGFDAVKESIQKGQTQLVLTASDSSAKTQKEINYLCSQCCVLCCQTPFTLDEYWYLVGKRVGVIAVEDEGFAKKIIAHLKQE